MSRDITPISFKTVPGRNKTQKWTKAPAVDYGGDEWGGYDDYGDYDDEDSNGQPAMPPVPTSQAPRNPYASSGLARKNSFDEGDETRAFSSGPQPTSSTHGETPQQHTPGRNAPRDFTNPEQVPAPLSMHSSPVAIQGERWPGRKESMSSKGTPPIPSGSPDKPLPFIRPSDIYKRIPEEIRRQSEDGPRPSMDSIGSGPRDRPGLGLDPVVESRESRVFMDGTDSPSTARSGKDTSPRLPDVTRFSGFGTEFLTGSSAGNEAGPASPHSPEAIVARVANAPVLNTVGGVATTSSSIQTTPTTRAPHGQDPAAEILAERQHRTSVESIAGGQPASLQHQPSAGFRSAVHTAFDRNDNSISRDNSQGSSDVHRSDTSSTAGISPIISRNAQFPSIAEETSTAASLHDQPRESQSTLKSSPGRADRADFEPGYRRSLDPPSTGTSPARIPGLDYVETRRLSTPMSAVPMDSETSDVVDQGAEIPIATLEPAETPASEVGELYGLGTPSATAPVPVTGRARSGTDYSMREADIAQTINSSSPDQDHEMPGLVDAQRDSQKLFLQTHAEKQPPFPISPGGGLREGTSGSRAGSPTKGRVREIADKYHGIDQAARRNSAVSVSSSSKALSTKSSWSNFDAGEKKLARQGTGQSESEMFSAYDNADPSPVRPAVAREESFRPDLPGGWISSAPTPVPEDGPGAGRVSPLTPQQANATLGDEEELTPTTKKTRLQEALTHEPSARTITNPKTPTALEQAKNAGSELGAALMASVGISHQTRDFASAEPAAPVDEREAEKPFRGMQPPTLFRHETDSDAPSVASTMPPTPPAKNTPKLDESLGDGYFNTVAPLRVKSREESPAAARNPAHDRGMSLPRPGVTTALSMEPGVEDLESDRLRKEIVRSLDPMPPVEDVQLIQDSLDAAVKQRRVENGENAQPPAEDRHPSLLQTRFSWEKPTPLSEEATASPEIKPEMSYERPRSKALHVVNPNEIESPIVETPVAKSMPDETLKPTTFGTPVTEKQEQSWTIPDTNIHPRSPSQSLKEIAPSPVAEREGDNDVKRQSYYASDSSQTAATSSPTQGQGGLSTSPLAPAKAPASGKPIPPFRNILALRTGDERIKSYNETRNTFATMNTGLGDWVGSMLALHPELASSATTAGGARQASPLQTSGTGIAGTFRKGHKASPSLAKFTNKFGPSESQNRSTSVGSVGEDGTPSSSAARVNIIRTTTSNTTGPSSSTTGLPAFDADKMQQKGKAFIAKTGVLGGKAQAGAKGLFAKGKSRFASGGSARSPSGNEKVTSAPSALRGLNGGSLGAVSSPAGVEPDVATSDTELSKHSLQPVLAGSAVTAVSKLHSENSHETSAVVALGFSQEVPLTLSKDELAGVDEHNNVFLPPANGGVDSTARHSNKKLDTDDEALKMDDVKENLSRSALPGGEASSSSSLPKDTGEGVAMEEREQQPDQASRNPEKSAVVSTVVDQIASLTRISTSPELPSAPPTMVATPSDRPSTAFATTESVEMSRGTVPNTPISAIRPSFSRHTSSKSASPFRGSSPFRRDLSQTPGSESRSRPLSMVWSDWLREKTCSVSRSGSRRRGSRPASLVRDKDDSAVSSSMALGNLELALEDFSDVAVCSSSTTAPMAIPKRTETWDSPDAVIPPRTPETRELVLGRLGILPSPAPTAATFESLGSRRRRRSSAARLVPPAVDGLGLDLETVPSQESGESPVRSIKTGLTGRGSPVRPAILGLRKLSEAEEMAMRPRQQRRVSDLEMLPSEQKRLSLGQGMPRPDSMILLQSQVDLLAGVEHNTEHENLGERFNGDIQVQKRDVKNGTVQTSAAADVGQLVEQSSRQATGKPAGQVPSDVWDDARSEISAEEGAADETQRPSTTAGTSRHSSVSSLGAPDTAATQVELGMPAQAVQAGPPPCASSASADNIASGAQQKLQRPGLTDRAMSYMPLPRDEAGLPVPETISTGSVQQPDTTSPVQQAANTAHLPRMTTTASLKQIDTFSSSQSPVAIDLSAMSGPPPGTPPFQQHPLFRNNLIEQETTSATLAAASVSANNTQDAPVDAGDRDAKRRSDFFGMSQAGETAAFPRAPPPNRITDQHGIEDLHASDDEMVPEIQPRPKERQPAEKQNRRRSGLWDVLTAKRASSGAKADIDEDYSAASSKAEAKARDDHTKRKLQKSQRASSSAMDLEPKKKRFSAFGSLFGRSATTAHGSNRPKKLTKMVPPGSENFHRIGSRREDRSNNSSTVSGNVQGYDEFEARRRRDLPAYQETMSNIRPAAPNLAQERVERPAGVTNAQPPSEGWYDPSAEERPAAQPYASPAGNMQPEYRRLHSQGRMSSRPASQVPPAFRPVEASYGGPVMAVGPPPDLRSAPAQGTSLVRSADHPRDASFQRQNSYETSYGSEFSGFSGQQVAARPQLYTPSRRSFEPDVSPVLSRSGPPLMPAQRVVSLGYETAQSPAKDYSDQQTPWAITIPPGQGNAPASRVPSHDTPSDGAHHPGPPPDLPCHQQHPQSQQYVAQQVQPSFQPMRPIQGYVTQSYANERVAYATPYSSGPNQQYQQQYSHAPQMQNPQYYPQQQHHYQQTQQQNRYYASQTSTQQLPPQHMYQAPAPQQYDSHRYHRRRSSGYSGRKDDTTAGQEDLVMRGASYPGQEWQPPALGRRGRD